MKLEKNVSEFVSFCSHEVGKNAEDTFDRNIFCEIDDLKIKSPIERILYCAIHTVREIYGLREAEPEILNYNTNEYILNGIFVSPQKKIGKYRVDFLVENSKYDYKNRKQKSTGVIVECDGHAFHERTEPERRKEKERDRFFIKNGFKVFHFTGSEIVNKPIPIACEILSFVCGYEIEPESILNIEG